MTNPLIFLIRSKIFSIRLFCWLIVAGLWSGTRAAHADRSPRLFVTVEDGPRIRHACGIGAPHPEKPAWGRFGARAGDYAALRNHFAQRGGEDALPGELAAAAFLQWVNPAEAGAAQRLALLNRALRQADWVTQDPLELALALDWGWNGLSAAARQEFLLAVRQQAKPLTPADSPLEPRAFREKLAALAVALVIEETDENGPAWRELRQQLFEAARAYFAKTLPAFIALRGLSPTSPAAAAAEENNMALALELAALLQNRRPSDAAIFQPVNRWMEHYLFATLPHPALQHQFLRDDGTDAPLSPVARRQDLQPLTAHLLATRTENPAAATVADRVEQALRNEADPLTAVWRWVPLVFDTRGLPRCDPARLPPARNFRGAVVFRGAMLSENAGARGAVPEADTAIWIEAGQPYLRKRQHFDAGHFLIYGGGQLAVEGRDDVVFEAVAGKGGFQGLGREPETFDFEQYFAATIAHNCMVFWDSARSPRWYGKLYAPVGGQRLFEGTCVDFAPPLETHPRRTARQLAYGWHNAQAAARDGARTAAYLALDLSPAYDPEIVAAYTREFVFLADFGLLVIDRVRMAEARITPTWILNLPARPVADGRELAAETHIAGSENDAGVWRADAAEWLRWSDRDGAVWCKSLLPADRQMRVVGGPARKRILSEGPLAGRSYVGGDADSFERLIVPAGRYQPRNAWYKLGQPTLLGPEFGKTPHWGRLEIEPPAGRKKNPRAAGVADGKGGVSYVFCTLLAIDRAEAARPPEALAETADQNLIIKMSHGDRRYLLTLPDGANSGGTLEWLDEPSATWPLPTSVAPDAPLPTVP